jgi:putative PIN family toxin of toxin-antitoxin system
MLDTNILVSVLIFKSKHVNEIIRLLADKHSLVLCSYVVDELHEVVQLKFPDKGTAIEQFLLALPFEFIYTPHELPAHELFEIRDKDDEKVLYSAILADVDILVTGDKDFDDIKLDKPEILKPADYIRKYG